MDYNNYEKKFRIKASAAGYSEEDILRCLSYAQRLIENKLPIIYNTSNLAALVGYRKNYLKRAALFTSFFYRSFTIKKRSQELRYLKEPLPSLKEIQIWILKNILYEIPISKYAKAYIPNRNILDNVKFHRNKEKVVTLDIENFFSCISRTSVEQIFNQYGYSSNVSNLLSKLCCCDDILPQGAPTSAYLSNIYLTNFDVIIGQYCNKINVRYTRYADDLTFSGEFDETELVNLVTKELLKIDLKINLNKTKVMRQSERQIVTGVVVNKVIQITKEQRKEIRQELYYIKKFGLNSHLQKTQNYRANYLPHLLGKINYSLYINPQDEEMLGYKQFINELCNGDI